LRNCVSKDAGEGTGAPGIFCYQRFREFARVEGSLTARRARGRAGSNIGGRPSSAFLVRRSPYDTSCWSKKISGLYQFSHHSPTRTLGAFVPTDSPYPRTVREHPIAGAFGRSESTLAFTRCCCRIYGEKTTAGDRCTRRFRGGHTSG
jgi:hypothetical protein